MNKHLNKLNLEVTDLETQVGDSPHVRLNMTNPIRFSLVCVLWDSAYMCAVCRWSVPGVTDGSARRLLCPAVQLLPHPRELRAEGDYTLQESNSLIEWADLSVH